jgi:hypothetical protein
VLGKGSRAKKGKKMIDFSSGRVATIFYLLCVVAFGLLLGGLLGNKVEQIQTLEAEIKALKAHVTEIETTNASCSATLQACLGSCIESQLLDTVKESIRIKR